MHLLTLSNYTLYCLEHSQKIKKEAKGNSLPSPITKFCQGQALRIFRRSFYL